MILQRSSEHAIRAALFLAQQAPGKLSPVHEIAAHTGVSKAYLAKILQRLASAGLVRSFRGPGKGMELGRAPASINLESIVCAIEGPRMEDACVLGIGICSKETSCTLHADWVPIRAAIQALLQNTNLANLVEIAQSHSNKSVELMISERNSSTQAHVSRGRSDP